MLKQILQTLFSCFAAIVLTTMTIINSPLPESILIAEHTPDHQTTTSTKTSQPALPQADKSNPATDEREKLKNNAQTNPSVPFDPYDYDAIRESNRKTYGEVKGKESK